MLIFVLFLIGAVGAAYFLGWRTGLEVLGVYVGCLIGANSPHSFITSRRWLAAVWQRAADRAKDLAQKGKG